MKRGHLIMSNSKSTTDYIQGSFIDEALKLIESDEMRNHLHKWVTGGKVKTVEICAKIIYNAPVPIETKLAMLKQLQKYDDSKHSIVKDRIRMIEKALSLLSSNDTNTTFYLHLYEPPRCHAEDPLIFKSFDDAIQYIKSLENKTFGDDENSYQENMDVAEVIRFNKSMKKHLNNPVANPKINQLIKYNIFYELGRSFPHDSQKEAYWFINEAGEILYFDIYCDDDRFITYDNLNFVVPFKAGDIVSIDCQPYESESKVLILENSDTFKHNDIDGVKCLYMNEHNKLDTYYFKQNSYSSHLSVIYRAKTYDGILTDAEAPLKIISEDIKKHPKLGSIIFRRIEYIKLAQDLYYSEFEKSLIPEKHSVLRELKFPVFKGIALSDLKIIVS